MGTLWTEMAKKSGKILWEACGRLHQEVNQVECLNGKATKHEQSEQCKF